MSALSSPFLCCFEDLLHSSGNDTPVIIKLASLHGIHLSTSCLAIGKAAEIVAIQCWLHQQRDLFKDLKQVHKNHHEFDFLITATNYSRVSYFKNGLYLLVYLMLWSLGAKHPVKIEIVILLSIRRFACVRLKRRKGQREFYFYDIVTFLE